MEILLYVVLSFGSGLILGGLIAMRPAMKLEAEVKEDFRWISEKLTWVGKQFDWIEKQQKRLDTLRAELGVDISSKSLYAECDACGELDDLTETMYYVGATGGPEEDSAFLCPSCQNDDEAIKDMRDELWAGQL